MDCSFLAPKILIKFQCSDPKQGANYTYGYEKFATFNKELVVFWKWYKMDAYFLWKVNKKSYALYQMVTLAMTLTLTIPNQPIFTFWVFCHISGMAEARASTLVQW